jgi:deazaflavin-dependent oxidoreductase (nitroreductase family)
VRLPDSLFAVINPTVRLLLRSRLHFLWSRNLMLITFTGRKTGRKYTTPVRYFKKGSTIHCFTSAENKWWRNLRGGAEVSLRLRGREVPFRATAIAGDPGEIATALEEFLSHFPQDAPYYGISMDRDNTPGPGELERAASETVMVVAHPL